MTEINQGIVDTVRFIQSTRDSGYRSTSSAIAELVDNSLEANSRRIDLFIETHKPGDLSISVVDDGVGMTPEVLEQALVFGGSSRFNSRRGLGRFGMGLPNGSLSQARRVDVFTWKSPGDVWWSYLDIDEVLASKGVGNLRPLRSKVPDKYKAVDYRTGTIVVWTKCDRLSYRYPKSLIKSINKDFSRIFRIPIGHGQVIRVNGEEIIPIDPLHLSTEYYGSKGRQYGPELVYPVLLDETSDSKLVSNVQVRFSELPVEDWHFLPTEAKREIGIVQGAGVSILRGQREIDYGWHFLGSKRRQNYDDWWRCEISFDPVLDEEFGVSNTKQGIRPSSRMRQILSEDLESIASDLTRRVRERFSDLPDKMAASHGELRAEKRDSALRLPMASLDYVIQSDGAFSPIGTSGGFPRLKYRISTRPLGKEPFLIPMLEGDRITVTINEDHPFFTEVYSKVLSGDLNKYSEYRTVIELLLLSFSRAEIHGANNFENAKLREEWSNTLGVFCK